VSLFTFTIPPSSTIKVEGGGNTIVLEAFTATPGAPGASAYQIAVANGFVGTETEWLASLAAQPEESAFDVDLVSIYNLSK
jgi:hypothetical protein